MNKPIVHVKLKTLMFGVVDGTNKRSRPCREWMDDIVSSGVRLDYKS